MSMRALLSSLLAGLPVAVFASAPASVPLPSGPDYSKYSEEALKAELKESAADELAILIPMRDGVGLATNVFRPKDAKGPLPTILWKTPYSELGMHGSSLRYAVAAVKRGYAFVIQNERGRYFSEGNYQILGYPQTDGYDALSWIAKQSWSNGKVGTLGCSSSAEWQLALAAQNHPAHAAMVPMSAGAGIGKVGRFQEQGNWYTGGVPRNLFFVWLYNVDNPLRAQLPSNLDPKMRSHISQYNDLAAKKPDVDWVKQIKHLPVDTMLTDLGEPPGTFEAFIDRTPADPAWRAGGLYHDDMGWGVPALWFNTWYDVSIGPNLELFNHARSVNSDPEASANQYTVVAPVPHCQYNKLSSDTKVGERSMGDARFDVDGTIFAWFDRWLKEDKNAFAASTPHVRYFTMGENAWKSAAQWPPKEAKTVRMYLRSGGGANSLYGDGRLEMTAPPASEKPDLFTYDPLNPVQTVGGGDCCNGGIVVPGAFDQRAVESRADVLVYSSEPLSAPMEVTGFVDAVLKVSSSAKDTDFAVKLVDVAPDGTAYIIADTIFRARYRNGFAKPEPMTAGKIYEIHPSPMATSIRFEKGHRVRVEVTSSNFPKFVRNLNTGGANESESEPVIARNTIHHAGDNASYVELPVVPVQ
jgi:putative CocE/NonD family hydrolase